MGLYGNMLSFFAGQLRTFTYFNQIAVINSGYVIDPNFTPQTLRGILQNSSSDIRDSNGNLVTTNDEYLWTTSVLQIGYFVTFDDTTYRIIPSNEWTFEGSFTKYTINRVVGDNGTPNTGNFTLGIGGTPV